MTAHTRRIGRLAGIIGVLIGVALPSAGFPQAGPGPTQPSHDATSYASPDRPASAEVVERDWDVVGVAADGSTIVLTPSGAKPAPVGVTVASGDQESVRRYAAGDKVRAVISAGGLLAVRPQMARVAGRSLWIGIIVAFGLVGAIQVILRTAGGSVLHLLYGKDGRYSNSQFQATLWFGVLVFGYVTAYVVRWFESNGSLVTGPGIPQNLLLLSGLSAISFVGAKTITESKIQKAMDHLDDAQITRPPGPPPKAVVTPAHVPRGATLRAEAERLVKPPGRPHFPADLLCDDRGRPDFGDVQMFLITILAVGSYLAQTVVWLKSMELVAVTSLPDVSSTILAAFGLGQGAYLVKKGVSGGTGE